MIVPLRVYNTTPFHLLLSLSVAALVLGVGSCWCRRSSGLAVVSVVVAEVVAVVGARVGGSSSNSNSGGGAVLW